MLKHYSTIFCTLIVCTSLSLTPYSLSARSLSFLAKDARPLAACATKPFEKTQAVTLPGEDRNVLKANDVTEAPSVVTQKSAWKKGLKYATIVTFVAVTCVAAYYGLAPSYETIALQDLNTLSSTLTQNADQRIANIDSVLGASTVTSTLPDLKETLGDTLTSNHLNPFTYFTENEAFDLGLHLTDGFIDDGFTSAGTLLGDTATLWDQASTALGHAAEHTSNAEALLDQLDQLLLGNSMSEAFSTALDTIKAMPVEPA
ncbi:MAG: hypothetical protein V6Z78_04735 [Holosporaceae bacterium]